MSATEPLRRIEADVVVVGGGIAGLAAAWRLRDLDVLVCEAGPRVGGRIRSEPRDPYWLNLGPHVLPPPSTDLGRLVADVGLATVEIPGTTVAAFLNGRAVSGGRPETLPLRLPMSLAARWSFAKAGARIRAAVREYAALAETRPADTAAARRGRLLRYRDEATFADFLGPLHPDVDALIRAAINRVSAEPEELSAGAGVGQFAATFSGSGSLYHRNIPGGTAQLPERIAAALGEKVLTDARVERVSETGRGVIAEAVVRGERCEIRAAAAVVATPAHSTAELVDGLDPALADALRAVRYGPYVVAAMLTKEASAMPWDDVYAMVAARKRFNMFFNTVSVMRGAGARAPGGSVTVYGAASLGRQLMALSDDAVAEALTDDLDSVFPGSAAVVDEVVVQRWPQGIPYSTPGRGALQDVFEAVRGRILLAGDYLGERGGLDTAAVSGSEAAAAAARIVGAATTR